MEKTKKKKRKSNNAADAWKLFRKNKAAMAGLVVLAVFVFFALFADLLIPYEAAVIQSPKDRLMAPCMQHWLGTDEFGRDMLARIIHGSRRSLSLGVGTTAVSLLLGPAAVFTAPGSTVS